MEVLWVIFVFILLALPEDRKGGEKNWDYLKPPEPRQRQWERIKMPFLKAVTRKTKAFVSYLFFRVKGVFKK